MVNSGVPDTIVDFWLGHTIGEMAEAYKGVRFEEVRKMYAESEKQEFQKCLDKIEKAVQDLLK
jgi:hemerythrin superfamily protein